MKEIRTIKMVEVTDVKFVAEDGTVFVGENAERDCRDHERTCDVNRVKKAFERIEMTELDMPFVSWFCDEYGFYRVQLNSKADFVAMMDYFNVVWNVYDNSIKAPTGYPYTMIVSASCDYVCEYKGDMKAELRKALEQWGN